MRKFKKMRRLLLVALMGVCGSIVYYSCGEKDNDPVIIPEIKLTAPADEASYSLQTAPNVSFQWTAVPEITAYVLKLSATQDLQNATEIDASANPAIVPATQLDALLATLGAARSEQKTIYWSIAPKDATKEAKTETRSLTLTRIDASVIVLTPAAAAIDANEITAAPTFAWTKIPEVNDYTIKFALADDFTEAKEYKDLGDVGSYTFESVDAYNTMLTTMLGVTETATVYWTVTPTNANPEVAPTAPGSFTATTIVWLKSPAADATIILSNDLSGNIDIRWAAKAGATSYKVVVAKDADLANVVFEQGDINGTSLVLPEENVQAVIATTDGLKRYKKNELYWGVKDNSGNLINDETRALTLYGRRIFVDDRAEVMRVAYPSQYAAHPDWLIFNEEPQTYTVAVVEYNSKEVVWLAEDLRNKAAWNPWAEMNAVVRTEAERAEYETSEVGCLKAALSAKYFNRTSPPVGYYYDFPYVHDVIPRSNTSDNDRLWRLPLKADFDELFAAANAAYGGAFGDNVLRHPDFTVSGSTEHANEWGMNIVANGRFTYGGSENCGTRQIWSEDYVYYQIRGDNQPGDVGTGSIYAWQVSGKTSYILGSSNGNNIRVIYTGDGE